MKFTKEYMDLGGKVYFYSDIDKLPDTKENAFLHHLAMDCRSWTFGRMTHRERENLIKTFLWANEQNLIKGDFCARWCTMNAMYAAFLSALDYDSDPADWRGNVR